MHSIAKYLLFVSFFLMVAAAIWVLARGPVERSWSVSQHVGRRRTTFLVFAIISSVSIACMTVFLWIWFIPTFHLPPVFSVIAAGGLLGQAGAAWVRYVEDSRKGVAHTQIAYGMAWCMLLMVIFLLGVPAVSISARIIGSVCAGWMITGILLLIFAERHARKNYLPYQASYIVCFYVALLAAAYIG